MAKKANRKMIGGFVVIAVVILVASVVIFGPGDLFKVKDEYVLFFDGSVKGLRVGSPVLFKGVEVGAVSRIVIRSNLKTLKNYIPIYIEVYPESFEVIADDAAPLPRGEELSKLIEMGLRAQLVTQSMITGQLMIEADMHPGTPVNLKNLEPEYMEIPTVPSAMAKLGKSLEKLNLQGISASLMSILNTVDRLLKNQDIEASLHELKVVLQAARGLVQNVNSRVEPLADNLNSTLTDARGLINNVDEEVKPLSGKVKSTLNDYCKLARDVDAKVDPLSKSAIAAMDAAESAIKSVDDLVGKDSATRADLENTLQELSGAARSLRILADYLEQHPDAIIKGKGY